MRLARKLFLFAAMTIAVLALSVGTASAQVELMEESGGHCPTVTKVGHHVEGGCHVEFQSTGEVPLFANIPGVGVTQISNCELHIEGRVGENGEGWGTQMVMTGHPAPAFPCLRTACDEAEASPNGHAEIPWQFNIGEAAGVESGEIRLCLRPSANAEGQSNTFGTVHGPATDLGSHEYEIGTAGSAEFHYEPGDFPFDVWVTNAHFRYETGSSRIEIVH